MSNLTEMIVTIATAITGLAIVAVLVSRRSDTSSVIQAAASGFNNAIGVAGAPVSGAAVHLDLSYPGGMYGGAATFGGNFG